MRFESNICCLLFAFVQKKVCVGFRCLVVWKAIVFNRYSTWKCVIADCPLGMIQTRLQGGMSDKVQKTHFMSSGGSPPPHLQPVLSHSQKSIWNHSKCDAVLPNCAFSYKKFKRWIASGIWFEQHLLLTWVSYLKSGANFAEASLNGLQMWPPLFPFVK